MTVWDISTPTKSICYRGEVRVLLEKLYARWLEKWRFPN